MKNSTLKHTFRLSEPLEQKKKIHLNTYSQVSPQIKPVTSVIGHMTEIVLTGSPEAVEWVKSPVGRGEFFSKKTQLPLLEQNDAIKTLLLNKAHHNVKLKVLLAQKKIAVCL